MTGPDTMPRAEHLLRVSPVLRFMSLPMAACGTLSDLGPGHVPVGPLPTSRTDLPPVSVR